MIYRRFIVCLVTVCAIFFGLPTAGHANETLFPEYTVVAPNVSFWIKIYTRYPTTQALVHDSLDLNVVYDVVDLKPAKEPGARKTNRQRLKAAGKKYSRILRRLAADPATPAADCRRVAALFESGADKAVFKQASRRVRCQVGQMDRFKEGLVRSGAYLDQIRAIFKSYGVPEDLAYLPHVESSFNIQAYSKYGAAGMWQFTRSTGRRYLTVNHILDERRDPMAATHAAARLLKENHAKLGSWPLAITAYNHGAAGMQRAKAALGDYPRIFTDYAGRTFKFASRNFYSEFLAARRIASNYESYFGELTLADPVDYQAIRLEGFVGFAELCTHLGLEQHALKTINPALRPPVLNGQKLIPKHYRVNLPPRTDEFDSGDNLASLLPTLYQPTQKPSRFYTVQRGDTAGKIAQLHHVRLEDLVVANNLNRRATVYVRQRLRIPQPGVPAPPKKESPRQEKTVVAVADAAVDASPPRVLASIPLAGEGVRYRRPGPAPADLIAMNGPQRHPVAPKTRGDKKPAAAVVNARVAFARIDQGQPRPVGIITVEVEETIGHYAEWAGVRASRIRHLNDIAFGRPLQLHQAIQIPLDNVTAEDFKARRLSFHQRLQRDFFAAYRVEALQQYRVEPGDSYWTLCHKKFDLPLWLLRHYNKDVNLAALQADQSLTIPAIQSIREEPSLGFDRSNTPDA